MTCQCFIIPRDVLHRIAEDASFADVARKAAADTARLSTEIRRLRDQALALTSLAGLVGESIAEVAASPAVTVYDCKHRHTLPGVPVHNPAGSTDATAARTFSETSGVAKFYKQVFNRNSIDNAGMTMMSSIHYGVRFNNAMWNGSQMLYGDGDGSIFVDFTKGNDVIGHELTHGVTQYSLQLVYADDAGGLNESLSDCFGSMFRQWEAHQDAGKADWLIGSDIVGPAAKTKGYSCLRDMGDPGASHCLAPQPTKYSQVTPGMDPHYSSGPPNLAFCTACKKLGGMSWERIGQVWYRAVTGFGPSPNMKMTEFANRTRQLATQLYGNEPAVLAAVDSGWKLVGL